ncbi:Alpha/Beta hydrolase protein [Macrophomina phaseolina]|uniref:Alpha/Beta hydrolase protein n=1 Tax=Macrophomina phaseolina TaxID=35725 RepID=A0ABQ8GCY3_9PEZI|nr:Alpha/Beta hydrolase protein [Macrophomina phaseolina]
MDSRTYPFYTFGDGQEVQATVHFDPRKKDETQGIAILFHGGGFVVGSKDTIPEAQISALAELGFISVAPNYRLCPHVSLWDGPLADASNVYFWSEEKLPGVLKSDVGLSVHPDKIVAIGYSAGGLLALHLGTLSPPPRATADFYGGKLLSDPSWSLPLPALSSLPDFDPSFLRKLFDEPLITFTTRAMERESAEEAEKHGGAPRPDFSRPRNAWLADHMKKGTHLAACVQDGNYERFCAWDN